ncbi:hypothetical protein HBI56_154740 [Parastagonospora nodorum]|nr:hypothetical protein HBH56_117410 [Parastagonospora nodorum]KAH3928894.1 hypothetical protein HBH54_131800 [Parastagonospora nodorum]KAH4024090.1 hypothetical protein HBI13_082830 [Parastagonospora nodorum]KAH4160368.1 hypothetical protein HBH43_178380 [Parastagonospora nodorum]KAH4160641.1 hypothetical protein HBH44_099150 [Parastagonospora nodorum]
MFTSRASTRVSLHLNSLSLDLKAHASLVMHCPADNIQFTLPSNVTAIANPANIKAKVTTSAPTIGPAPSPTSAAASSSVFRYGGIDGNNTGTLRVWLPPPILYLNCYYTGNQSTSTHVINDKSRSDANTNISVCYNFCSTGANTTADGVPYFTYFGIWQGTFCKCGNNFNWQIAGNASAIATECRNPAFNNGLNRTLTGTDAGGAKNAMVVWRYNDPDLAASVRTALRPRCYRDVGCDVSVETTGGKCEYDYETDDDRVQKQRRKVPIGN